MVIGDLHMSTEMFDREAADVATKLPAGPRLAIIGSTSFWHVESEDTCTLLGRSLAAVSGLVLVTGGVAGVGKAVGRCFWDARRSRKLEPDVFHVLPRGFPIWDYGNTIFAGSDMGERREVLGRLADIYVVIEGGPGTSHEASIALTRAADLIPVGRSGGHSAILYPQIPRPVFASEQAWLTLDSTDASPKQVADAITDIVEACLSFKTQTGTT